MPVTRIAAVLVAAGMLWFLPSPAFAVAVVRSATGDITAAVGQFRADIGGVNNGTGGSFPTGQREINWDGAGAPDAAITLDPPTMTRFLNRGSLFTTPGTNLEISGAGTLAPPRFSEINATYAAIFQTFSSPRLFSPLGSTTTDVTFFLPNDSTAPAVTRAFGAIFTDVDESDSTRLEFFDLDHVLLFSQFVSPSNQGLSFLGVSFSTERVARIRITSGDTPLGPTDGGGTDVVVMDNFIFGEPQGVPTGPAVLLIGAGLAVLGGREWRRRRRGV